MPSEIHRVIVGTAGHIDHGKSSLVRALTGIDPDRLKEEQARGMTIDLGFAPYRTRAGRLVGIIDVPGHERFIKNMVAGASSVDVFLLVVAADDGVMPQTREHVEILEILGARRGLVAVTKIDLVEDDLRDLALADIQDYLAGTVFQGAPLVAVSSTTGEGIEELRTRLEELVERTEPRSRDGLFRMPIQRVFSAHGHGTVVTGVPISGAIRVGDVLEILPGGQRGKVRGLQAYHEERADAGAGHSSAVNLADVDYREVHRGHVLAQPGYFSSARMVEARLSYLASAPRPLRHGAEVRFHVGTAEVFGRVVLLDRRVLEPGAEALVQFRLREPIVAVRGDRFVVREVSSSRSVGGGVVVGESERPLTARRRSAVDAVRMKAAAIEDPARFLEGILLERGATLTATRDVARLLRCPEAEANRTLEALLATGRVVRVGREHVLGSTACAAACAGILAELKAFHEREPIKAFADALVVRTALRQGEALFDGLVARLEEEGRILTEKGGRLRLPDAGPRLSPAEQNALAALEADLPRAGLVPPSTAEWAQRLGLGEKQVAALLRLLADRGVAVRAGEFFFHRDAIERALAAIRDAARAAQGEILIPRVRDVLGTTRKYLIPLLEHLDSRGVTVRRGDRRYFVERATEPRA